MGTTERRHRNFLLRGSIFAALGALVSYGCGTTVTDTADGSSEGAGAGTTTGPGGGDTLCAGAQPILQDDGTESGYAQCPDGTVHRYAQMACSIEVGGSACVGDEESISCTSDAECTSAPNGRCIHGSYVDFSGGAVTTCGCAYPCASDDDCSADTVCICDGVVDGGPSHSFCAAAECIVNNACSSGECGVSSYDDGCGQITSLACRNNDDACRLDADCGDTDWEFCAADLAANAWSCTSQTCAIGRPLLVADGARTAPATERDDWSARVAPETESLDSALRDALATQWQHVAAFEHASVASFARFSLQLLALGAPPELLSEAQRAAMDEVEHARIAYAIAGAYAGRKIGPGPLDLSDVPLATDRRTAMLELVAEACVGETLGVAEAYELARLVQDPNVRRVHERIAADEQRHAELAWRALAWMLEDADDTLRTEVRATFDAAAASAAQTNPADPAVVAPEHGLPSGRCLGDLRRQALHDVVLPCAAQLFS
jgi:hypothetical protein